MHSRSMDPLISVSLVSCRALTMLAQDGSSDFGLLYRQIHHNPGEGTAALWAFGVLMLAKALGNDTGGSYAAFEAQVWPGQGPPPHAQSRTDETWFMLEGHMTWYIGDKAVDAKPGTYLFLPRFHTHSWRVNSADYARMLIVFSPGEFGDYFVRVARKAEGVDGIPVPHGTLPPQHTAEELANAVDLAITEYGVRFDFDFQTENNRSDSVR